MSNLKPDTMQIASAAFSKIAEKFSHLKITEDKNVPVEISLTIPEQTGLKHKVWLCLQNNDELHFSVGHFWLEWFPCTKPEKVESYIDAVTGFLAGNYRIVEHYRGKRCVKAELQKPEGNDWQTIGTWGTLSLPFPRKKTYQEIRNS